MSHALPAPSSLLRRLVRRTGGVLVGRAATFVLAFAALALGIATFVELTRGVPGTRLMTGLVLANLAVLLLLGAVLAARLTRMWMERRRGEAGARLHVRLVLLFGVVAVTPTILVGAFSTAFFDIGIQTWFADRVQEGLRESLLVAQGYAEEHRNNIRADALGMANDLSRAGRLLAADPNAFADFLANQTALRGLTDALIYEPVTGQVVASAGIMSGGEANAPPPWATDVARQGDVAVLGSEDQSRVRAVVALDATPPLMLTIARPVDPTILDHLARASQAVAEYERLSANRSGLQLTFVVIFAVVALLVLAAAVLIGLAIATRIVRPVGGLITAAERVRAGDLSVRVAESDEGDEIAGLARAFNRMTGQLAAQRQELMGAYGQIDERRRFTEAVLAGVSAGVIGLDQAGHIELPNRAASDLLGIDLLGAIGRDISLVVPEFADLLAQARAVPGRPHTAEVQIGPPSNRRTLLLRVGADRSQLADDADEALRPREFHFVATFDDITELQSAQRTAAWADVARRIAHEIKNPLTPIQLSAERLKRRFAREITSDPEIFIQCADTIVRHVGEIGRMVSEFSDFARMPQPVIRAEDAGRIVREALVLQRTAHADITWDTDIPAQGPQAQCDRRLLGQALTNLLQNASDAVHARMLASGGAGRIAVTVATDSEDVRITIADDGIGLPQADRARLTEPYVTHKPKGTGLGLAIVKKIMEDHGGRLTLADRTPDAAWPGGGAEVSLVWPAAGR
jgi:two-component system nitrogen regulation sensor histidine kinase NtrY